MLLKRATILGKHTHLSDLLDKKLGASTGWERPPAMNTRLFGRRVERYTMSRADRRRHRRPCACPLPAGENTIDFQRTSSRLALTSISKKSTIEGSASRRNFGQTSNVTGWALTNDMFGTGSTVDTHLRCLAFWGDKFTRASP